MGFITYKPFLHEASFVIWSYFLLSSDILEAPMNVEANVLSATTINITWDQSGSKTTTNTTYEVSFEVTDDNEYYPRNGSFIVSDRHFTVQNLHPFREYLLSVTHVDQAGVRSETIGVKARTFSAGGLSCSTCSPLKWSPVRDSCCVLLLWAFQLPPVCSH